MSGMLNNAIIITVLFFLIVLCSCPTMIMYSYAGTNTLLTTLNKLLR